MVPVAPSTAPQSCCDLVPAFECEHWRAISAAACAEEHAQWEAGDLERDARELPVDHDDAVLPPVSYFLPHVERPEQPPALTPEALRALPPDARLAALLSVVHVPELEPALAVEVVAAYKRLEAWAAAQAARAAGAVSRLPEMEAPGAPLEDERHLNVAGEELAIRLGATRGEATTLIELGRRAFTEGGALSPTGEALESGHLDWRKACTIVRTLSRHPDEVAWAAQEEVLPDAGLQTHNQLVRRLAHALVAADPEDADARHRRAARERRVSRPRPLPDGMAAITAVLPADDAVHVDVTLHAAARAARRAGDRRSQDQLRADALATLARAALDAGWIGSPPRGTPGGGPSRNTDGGGVALSPEVSSPTVEALPGARQVRPMRLAHPSRAMVRLTVPLSVMLPAMGGAEGPGESGKPLVNGSGKPLVSAGPAPGATSPRAPTPGKGQPLDVPGESPPPGAAPGTSPPRTAPASAADPLRPGEVAHLAGHGPVPPVVARALAAGGVWRRVVTDPLSGAVLDVGRQRYRPPAELAEFVRLRDRTCVRPGCTVPADQCELDHTVAWSAGGVTAASGLGPLCLRDHQVKSSGAFTVSQPAPGVFHWVTPAGLRYRRNLDGTVIVLPSSYREVGEL